MPEQEFEIYLSLLSKLLRLNPAQKAAISDELRDHMEQRLADLIQKGISREDAIKTAMEEFGDVSGLALDLTRVSRTPLKQVVVGSTLAASAVAAAIICWVSLFAPEHRIAAPLAVHAQTGNSPSQKAEEPKTSQAVPVFEDEDLFPEFLAKMTNLEFVETPLSEACSFLSEMHDVPILLHRQALEDAGIAPDYPVRLVLKELTFEEALNHLTRRLQLSWEVDGGIIRITAAAPERYLTRQFDLHKLTKLGYTPAEVDSFLRMAVDGWEDTDQERGTRVVIGSSVVVRQTYQRLRRIARALNAVERQEPMTFVEPCTGRDRLLSALREPGSVEFQEVPLVEALGFLSNAHNVPIMLDVEAIVDEGVPEDTPVTLTLKNRPLGKLLDAMFRDIGLAYIVRDGVIRITTTAVANEDTTLVAFNVRDLAATDELRTQLSDVILNTTTGNWIPIDQEGGDLVLTDAGGRMLVRQSDSMHLEIQTLLEQLRRARKDNAADQARPEPRSKLVTKSYRMPTEVAADLNKALISLVAPESWKQVDGETPQIHLVAAIPQMDQVDGVVSGGTHEVQVITSPAEKSKGGTKQEPATTRSMVVRPRSMLIIRQTPLVHREIQKFLTNIGVFYEVGELDRAGRGGMGGPVGGIGGHMGGFGGGFF